MRFSCVIFALILLLAACSRRPKNIISEDRMVAIMTDLQIAEAYERSGDSHDFLQGKDRELLGRGVLMKHGVSVEEMDSTIAWYGRNMDEYSKLYKKIDIELAKRQAIYAKAAGESDDEGSIPDLWPYNRHYVIDNKGLTDGFSVDIPVTELSQGDKIIWRMSVSGASARNLSLGVEYENGTSEMSKTSNRGQEKRVEISLQTDSLKKASRIFLSASFDHPATQVLVDSIQLLHTPFELEEYHKAGFQRKVGLAGRKIILPPDTSANSSLVPDSITLNPSESKLNKRGLRTLR